MSDYINNDELIEQIDYLKKSGIFSEKLGELILNIAKNYANKGNFSGYTWVDDMIGDAVLTCVKYIKNFNLDKSDNAFAYVTTICQRSFMNYINKQKKHSEIKDILYNNQHLFNNDSEHGIDYSFLKKKNE